MSQRHASLAGFNPVTQESKHHAREIGSIGASKVVEVVNRALTLIFFIKHIGPNLEPVFLVGSDPQVTDSLNRAVKFMLEHIVQFFAKCKKEPAYSSRCRLQP